MLEEIKEILLRDTEYITNIKLSEFGYRERIKIERSLFLLLKLICRNRINYNLKGFNKRNRDLLLKRINNEHNSMQFAELIEKIFLLKFFIQSLSNKNPYVMFDALSRTATNQENALKFVKVQIESIIKKINHLP